jgi:hypothetical protein
MTNNASANEQRATTRYTPGGARIECDTHIDAPREFVWELIQEPTRRIEWDARLTGCELLTPRPLGKGARTRTKYALLGWVDLEYTSWQPAARSAVKTSAVSRGNRRWSSAGTHDRAVAHRAAAPLADRAQRAQPEAPGRA